MQAASSGEFPTARIGWILLLVGAAAYLPYASTLGHGFAFDDGPEIVQNEFVRSPANLARILTGGHWEGAGYRLPAYRPLTTFSYALNFALSGLAPFTYHLFNTLLHALISVAVFLLARSLRLTIFASTAAAALFAVHPVHVEAVANVSGRKELLATGLVLAAVLLHRRGLARGGSWWALAALCSLAAMLSKETGVVTIGLILAADLLVAPGGTSAARRSRLVVAYLSQGIVLTAYVALRWTVVEGIAWGEVSFMDNPLAHVSTGIRLMTATSVIGRGLGLLVAPLRLTPDYSHEVIPLIHSPAEPWFWISLAVVASLVVWAVRARRESPVYLLAVGWYGLALLPAANLLLPIGTIFGERLLYLPSVGFCLAVGVFASRMAAARKRAPVLAALSVVLLVMAARTVSYAATWRDDRTLFRAAVEVAPNSTKIHNWIGQLAAEDGRREEALQAYERSLAILPQNLAAGLNLAMLLEEGQQFQEAEQICRRQLEFHPDNVLVLYRLAALRRLQGAMEEARSLWERILELNPRHAGSLLDLGTFHFLRGDLEPTGRLWHQASIIEPGNPTAWYNLGLLYERRGELARARHAWRRFLEVADSSFATQRSEIEGKLRQPA